MLALASLILSVLVDVVVKRGWRLDDVAMTTAASRSKCESSPSGKERKGVGRENVEWGGGGGRVTVEAKVVHSGVGCRKNTL